jgi:hypothetical protein
MPFTCKERPASPVLLPVSVANKDIFRFELFWQALCNLPSFAALERFAHVPGDPETEIF